MSLEEKYKKKNVDVLNSEQLAGNPELVNEVLKSTI